MKKENSPINKLFDRFRLSDAEWKRARSCISVEIGEVISIISAVFAIILAIYNP